VTGLVARAEAWLAQDPDETTRAELRALLDAGDEIALADRFDSRLAFGTAGLRGELGAGPNRMNRVLVSQAAKGLAAFLLEREASPSIVIGFDGRENSDVFARDTAEIMAGAGVRAIVLPRLLPTPVLAFAVRHLDASAGVMVTASHNPARDNGYKVYLGGHDRGSQIVSPSDAEIARAITVAAETPIGDYARSSSVETADESVVDEYVARTASLGPADAAGLKVAYTAMHGVGWEVARRTFVAAGFAEPAVVAEQIEPDATFPTVAFPNPEEPGAMDLLLALAEREGSDVAVANDPDADRLAIAIPTPDGWRALSGNEIGSLLGWRAAERVTRGEAEGETLAASLVSSPALARIAAAYRLDYADTLTGFKWISRVGGLAYGYEEALGYLVDPGKVLDKDGISAAVDLLALAAELKSMGTSIHEHLEAFAERFGAYASGQISLRVAELSEIPLLMSRLRADPPRRIGSLVVERIDDFRDGFGQFPPSDILRFWLAGGSRVIVRPSGTEPKLKVYLDAAGTDGDAAERIESAGAVIADLEAGMREVLGA
jgi:phosphomannomutase